MQREQAVAVPVQQLFRTRQRRQQVCRSGCPGAVVEAGVDHDVADEVNLRRADALPLQVAGRVPLNDEEQRRGLVGEAAVDLGKGLPTYSEQLHEGRDHTNLGK